MAKIIKNNNSKIKENNPDFYSVFYQSPAPAVIVGLDRKFIKCNKNFTKVLGYKEKDIIGKSFLDITYKEDFDIGMPEIKKCLQGKIKFFNVQKRYICKNKKIIFGDVSVSLIYGKNKKPLYFLVVIKDITDQKKAEEKLKESEEKFNMFLKNSPIYVYFKDENMRVVKLSKNFEQMLHKPLKEILGKSMFEIFPSKLAKSMVADDKRVLRGGKKVISIEEFNGKTYETIKFPLIIKGKDSFLAGYTIDITEKKRVEEELKLINERLIQAQKIALIGNWEANLSTGELYWSQVIFDIFGFDSKSFKPSVAAFRKAVHPEDRNLVLESERLSEKTGIHDVVHRIIRSNGEIRFVHELAKREVDFKGKIIKLLGTVQDITDQKKAEEKLKESEEKFRVLFESSKDAIMTLEPPFWKFTSGNKEMIKLFGAKSEKDFISRAPWEFSPKYQSDGQLSSVKAKVMIEKAMKEGSNFFEWTHKKIKGAEFIATVLLSRVEEKDKVYLQATVRDITDSKKLEKNKDEFMSVVSHQLKTPPTAIKWMTESIIENKNEKLTQRQSEYLKDIYNENEQIIKIVRSLLDASHVGFGQFSIAPVDFDVFFLIKDILKKIDPLIIKNKINLIEKYNLERSIICTDSNLLRIIIENLLTNAVNYNKKNGKVFVEVFKGSNGKNFGGKVLMMDSIIFKISDTGCGIPKNQHHMIYDKFFRAENARGRYTNGTGLGLYIVKSIVENLKGEIWFTSEENKGTTFYFSLPLSCITPRTEGKKLI